jgi:diguanylate cyclase (GGDEF)-like protein
VNLTSYYNAALCSILVIIVALVDYSRKYNTDNFLRILIFCVLGGIFTSTIMDLTMIYFTGKSGIGVNIMLNFVTSIFFISQIFYYYTGVVFIDYLTYGNIQKAEKLLKIIFIFLALYIISIFINIFSGYYFIITNVNDYIKGSFYIIHLLLCYAPILFIFIDICLLPKHLRQMHIFMLLISVLIIAMGATIDLIFIHTRLMWLCTTAAILYIYFFIIKSDSKIDSLTGIGNRYSFNEFISKLSKQAGKENYTFVILNIDRIKEINVTFGHLEGDNALRDIAAIIKGYMRNSDFAFRYSGDEFMLAAKTDRHIELIIDRINNAVEIQNSKRIRPYQLNLSYGYNIYTTNSGQSIQEFLANLDNVGIKQCLKN